MVRQLVLIAALVCACGDSDEVPPVVGGDGGSAGDQGEAGAPPEVGPSWACPPGTLAENEQCIPAGIPEEQCGAYFAPDGDGSCVPVLPAEACGPGLMAIPGETVCHPAAPCAAGTWGDIPLEAGTIYVDATFIGVSDGTANAPYAVLQDAVDAAADGGMIAIAAGTYGGAVIEDKGVRLWGKCPAEVLVDGDTEDGLHIDGYATEVHHLAVKGFEDAVEVRHADVLLDGTWLHGARYGVHVFALLGPASVTVRGSLLADNTTYSLFSMGADVHLEDSVLRDTTLVNAAMYVQETMGTAVTVELTRSLVERHRRAGIVGSGVELTMRDVVIRDIEPTGQTDDPEHAGVAVSSSPFSGGVPSIDAERVVIERSGPRGFSLHDVGGRLEAVAIRDCDPDDSAQHGDGIYAANVHSSDQPSDLLVRFVTIDRVRSNGVFIIGQPAVLEGVRVRDVEPYQVDGSEGRGIVAGAVSETFSFAADVIIRGSVIERVHDGGILIVGSHGEVDGVLVRDVMPATGGSFGRGISFDMDYNSALPSSGSVRGSLIESCHEVGVGSIGSSLEVSDTEVKDVAATSERNGACFFAEFHPLTLQPGALTLQSSRAEGCEGFGLLVVGANAVMSSTGLFGVSANPNTATFGDGITVASATSIGDDLTALLDVSDSVVEGSQRAGIAVFGASATLRGAHLLCNTIHLNGEPSDGIAPLLDDQGGNECGCEGARVTCKMLSEGLEAPGHL